MESPDSLGFRRMRRKLHDVVTELSSHCNVIESAHLLSTGGGVRGPPQGFAAIEPRIGRMAERCLNGQSPGWTGIMNAAPHCMAGSRARYSMRGAHNSYESAFIPSPHPNEQAWDIERQASSLTSGRDAGLSATSNASSGGGSFVGT